MSPQSSQAACMGCLVNPPWPIYHPDHYYHPTYGPLQNPWPLHAWDQQPGSIPPSSTGPLEQEQPANLDHEAVRKEIRERLYGTPDVALTDDEKQVLELLARAWDKFNSLDRKHPSDNSEFLDSIHRAQQIIGLRVARRVNPEVWRQASEG